MKMDLQHSDYYGIQQMISFNSRATPHKCNQQTPQQVQIEKASPIASIFDSLGLLIPGVIAY